MISCPYFGIVCVEDLVKTSILCYNGRVIVELFCNNCKEKFQVEKWRLKNKNRGKFCSKKCAGTFNYNLRTWVKNNPVWNRGLTKKDPRVLKYTLPKIGRKRPEITGENHVNWKGENVGYHGLHTWLIKQYGKATKCEHCNIKTTKRYEWANISGEYKRYISDWKQLCSSCHHKFDDISKKLWETRKKNLILTPCQVCNKLTSSFKWQLCKSHYKLEWQKVKKGKQIKIPELYLKRKK